MIQCIFGGLDLSRIPRRRTRGFGVVIDYPVLRQIVFVVTASVQNANRDAVWSGFRVCCVELIDPNALSATIDAQFTQSLWLDTV